jgi:SAM-dependent methyltransferase
VECVCCGGKFRKFLPYGPHKRPDALCPSCHTLERNRLLWLYLERETDVFRANRSVLHFAPEPIIQQRLLAMPNLRYVSVDIASPLASVQADIMALPFTDNSFDVILITHVLAHVQDDRKAMAEMLRVLKPGGFALVQEHVFPELQTTREGLPDSTPAQRQQAYDQDDRYRNYGPDFKARLEQQGFQVQQADYNLNFSPLERKRYGLSRQEFIFRATKPSF